MAALLAGCAVPGLRPTDPPPGEDPSIARASGESASLVAATGQWRHGTRWLQEYFIPLKGSLTNSGDEALSVRYQDILLIDEANRQIPALSPREVVEILFGFVPFIETGPAAGKAAGPLRTCPPLCASMTGPLGFQIRLGPYPYDPFWDPWWPAPYDHWDWGPCVEMAREILHAGLPEGDVRPGLMVSGFLYFKESLEESEEGKVYRMSWRLPAAGSGQIMETLELRFVVAF